MGHLPEREVCHMRRHIDFDKIGITDDVMFCTVLSNSEDCREFLQRILGIEISSTFGSVIRYITSEDF